MWFNCLQMKKTVLLFIIFSACGGGAVDEPLETELTTTTSSSTTTTTTPTVLESQLLTLDDYLGDAFEPVYSPNELLFFEKIKLYSFNGK